MTSNKSSLVALIHSRVADALARDSAAVCASLLGVAQAFAQFDQRLAVMDAKLERLLAERSPLDLPSSRAEQSKTIWEACLAVIDQRIKAALDRDQRERCEATADVVRSVLAEVCSRVQECARRIRAQT